ncbi:hypothetical protein ACQEUU_37830 [Nonomuraea sp. CA-218870]|uniref:hypothetical protein n=1 Tax=Nonomuraea sp. CA-218870 TaxID=3239998 RepID=UPI003D8C846B
MPLPEIPEFTTWEDADGWHATWTRPLTAEEERARIPEQADAPRLAELETACAWLRIRRDLANRPKRQVWRTADLASQFRTGDPT